ncbi:ThiF family adenylyltransferase [Terrarubrum flagellatum]|uniref:ThiF family adenylyltransferase n=1 Tax=Terrirubrum flagellatum TaxID=2895980 RepID=UPI003145271F
MTAARLSTSGAPDALVRMAEPDFGALIDLIFRRHPAREWGSFAWFGWRDTPGGLVLTLAGLAPPEPGDLDESEDILKIQSRYMTRVARRAERQPFAVGVIHSHPEGAPPRPSALDDDMDSHLADFLSGFAPARPYASLIFSRLDGKLAASGRIFFAGGWRTVQRIMVERRPDIETWPHGEPPPPAAAAPERVARFSSAFGEEAHQRLRRSTVAVIGAGGTGSAAIPILARAGIGRIIVADIDRVSESNLERMHGSMPIHAQQGTPKALLAKRHVAAIDPSIRVDAYMGRLPQTEIIDAVASADVILGCTDQQHSRVALSEMAIRYLVPAIDCAGLIEGRDGRVTGQIIQLTRFLADDPCPYCRSMVDPTRAAIELLSPEEREAKRAALKVTRGPDPTETPQIDTVGYITTVSGTFAAGYAIGWMTGRFDPPFQRMQMNFVAEGLGVTDRPQKKRANCRCAGLRGSADQGADRALVSAPSHWPPVERIDGPIEGPLASG